MRTPVRVVAGAVLVIGVYTRWIRPWELRWGASDEEVAMRAPGDELVADPHLAATRAVSVRAAPEDVWPWLVQIGHGRAGWYSYDRLDNQGRPSARRLIPAYQHMRLGDVVAMSESKGKPFGPSVLALDPPQSMLWGDTDVPHRFTWLWMLRPDRRGGTRLISRVRTRFTVRDPLFALLMEFADPFMMRRCMLNIAERAQERTTQGTRASQVAVARS